MQRCREFVWVMVLTFAIAYSFFNPKQTLAQDNAPVMSEAEVQPSKPLGAEERATSYLSPEQFEISKESEPTKQLSIMTKDDSSTQAEKQDDMVAKPSIGSGNSQKQEAEQDIMEKALELLSNSQEYWVKGDIENALDILDRAYALLLDANGDPAIARQKDDIRLLISKRILAIYTSKRTVTDGKRSEIPIVINEEVLREIRSFQTVERDFFINAYKRSSFFRPVILEELKKEGLPKELSWLPLVESGFQIRALSRARALGLWQFISSTGYKYGLNRDKWIDERMDVEKSTQAAIAYLKELHNMFGDWLTVLAAYNCGEGAVLRVISRQHINYLDRFWDLYNQLPNETARYVPRFLATLEIIRDPKKYGMEELEEATDQQPYVYKSVRTNKTMSLRDIASRINVSEDLMATLNAELRYKKTPDREYNLKVPPEAADLLVSALAIIPELGEPTVAAHRNYVLIQHKVKSGETLSGIAKRYGITLSAIRGYNKFLRNSDIIRIGQRISVPVRNASYSRGGGGNVEADGTITYTVKSGETLSIIAQRHGMTLSEILKYNKSLKNTDIIRIGQRISVPIRNTAYSRGGGGKTGADGTIVYKVKKGDTLFDLARRFETSVSEIKEMNQINGDMLRVGQVLVFTNKT